MSYIVLVTGADPYVFLKWDNQTTRSTVFKDTLNPEFNFSAILYRRKPQNPIVVEVTNNIKLDQWTFLFSKPICHRVLRDQTIQGFYSKLKLIMVSIIPWNHSVWGDILSSPFHTASLIPREYNPGETPAQFHTVTAHVFPGSLFPWVTHASTHTCTCKQSKWLRITWVMMYMYLNKYAYVF